MRCLVYIGFLLVLGLKFQNANAQNVDFTCHWYTQCCKNIQVSDEPITLDDSAANCQTYKWLVKANDDSKHLVLKLTKFDRSNKLSILQLIDDDVTWTLPFDSTEADNYFVTNKSSILIQLDSLDQTNKFFSFQIIALNYGGKYHNNGSFNIIPDVKKPIAKVPDAYFTLDGPDGRQVVASLDQFSGANQYSYVQFFDGFTNQTELARYFPQSGPYYPVFATSNRILIATRNFTNTTIFSGSFYNEPKVTQVNFENHGSYELSGPLKKATAYRWLVKPSEKSDQISFTISVLDLAEGDFVKIFSSVSDNSENLIIYLNKSLTSPRSWLLPNASEGFTLEYYVHQQKLSKLSDKIIVSANYELFKGCGTPGSVEIKDQAVTSPGYPNQYFYDAMCQWSFSIPKFKIAHLTVNDIDTAVGDSLMLSSHQLPKPISLKAGMDDFILTDSMTLTWTTHPDGGQNLPHKGFSIQQSVNDCGAVLVNSTGTFSTPKNQTALTCKWLITPNADGKRKDANNVRVEIDFDAIDPNLHVYDGASVKYQQISPTVQNGKLVFDSRSNNVLVVYSTAKGKPMKGNFQAQYCSSGERCQNGYCLHPEWLCNGINECGDNSDEINCGSGEIACNETNVQVADGETQTISLKQAPGINVTQPNICTWNITANKGSVMVVELTELNLIDQLDLIMLRDSPAHILKTFTAQSKPNEDVLITSADNLVVTFGTNRLSNLSDFALKVTGQNSTGHVTVPGKIHFAPTNSTRIISTVIESTEGQVILNPSQLKLNKGEVVQFYDGLTGQTLITQFNQSGVYYPVISKSSTMIVVARNFVANSSFTASASGGSGTNIYDEDASGIYRLKQKVNAGNHTWIVKPTGTSHTDLISLTIDTLTLDANSTLTIFAGAGTDSEYLLQIEQTLPGQRSLYLPAGKGFTVIYSTSKGGEADFSAHYEVVPGCGGLVVNDVESPGYPNQYFFNTNCIWSIPVAVNQTGYLRINKIDLVSGDTLSLQIGKQAAMTLTSQSADVLLMANSTLSWKSGVKNIALPLANAGFSLSTSKQTFDCGDNIVNKSGSFNSPASGNCNWIITAPREGDEINNINLRLQRINKETTVTVIDDGNLYGPIANLTWKNNTAEFNSTTNKLVVQFATKSKSTGFNAKFTANDCVDFCDNGTICLQKEWICDNKSHCFDGKDENNCLPYQDCGNISVSEKPINLPNHKLPEGRQINCAWTLEAPIDQSIIAYVTRVILHKPRDSLIITDGSSSDSPKLYKFTQESNQQEEIIVSSQNLMWINLFAINDANEPSQFNITVRSQAIGGRLAHAGSLTIPAKQPANETVFFEIELEREQQVRVDFSVAGNETDDWLAIFYDGFSTNSPLAKYSKKSKIYPVISKLNKMLIQVHNVHGNDSAHLEVKKSEKVSISQNQSDTLYITNDTAGITSWIITPKILRDDYSVISLHLNKWILNEKDTLVISDNLNRDQVIASFNLSILTPRVIYIPAKNGAFLNFAPAKVGSSASYEVIPDCKHTVSLDLREPKLLTSPGYPNIYPSNAVCFWKFVLPVNHTVMHITFVDLDVASDHPVVVAAKPPIRAFGKMKPDDLIVDATNTTIVWNSRTFNQSAVNGYGFSIQVTSLDCGATVVNATDKFQVPDRKNTTQHCMWLIQVDELDKSQKLNLIEFDVSKSTSDSNGQFEGLTIYDGGSVRAPISHNDSTGHQLSRTNKILLSYKYDYSNTTAEPMYSFEYITTECKDNKTCTKSQLCMHQDWICNNIDDCGDNSDEIGCKGAPPSPTPSGGVNGWWIVFGVIAGIAVGVLLTIYGPKLVRRFRGESGPYARFGSGDDGT